MEASTLTPAASRAGILGRRSPLLKLQGDERLVAMIRDGHDHAFEVLFERYHSRLLAFCRHMLRSTEDAEDVLQEVFVKAHAAMLADERHINVRPWLYRIARNRCLNHLRRPVPEGQDSMDVMVGENGVTTADRVQKREDFRALVADVQDLPETQRTALLLREIEALSYEEIAETMDTTIPAVKSLLVRARMSLAEATHSRQLTCGEVRLELAEAAEGLRKASGPVRHHVKRCEGCGEFRGQLRSNTKTLAAMAPIGPLALMLKGLIAKFGWGGSGSAASGSTAGSGVAGSTGAVASGAGGAAAGAGGAAAGGAGVAGGAAAAGGAAWRRWRWRRGLRWRGCRRRDRRRDRRQGRGNRGDRGAADRGRGRGPPHLLRQPGRAAHGQARAGAGLLAAPRARGRQRDLSPGRTGDRGDPGHRRGRDQDCDDGDGPGDHGAAGRSGRGRTGRAEHQPRRRGDRGPAAGGSGSEDGTGASGSGGAGEILITDAQPTQVTTTADHDGNASAGHDDACRRRSSRRRPPIRRRLSSIPRSPAGRPGRAGCGRDPRSLERRASLSRPARASGSRATARVSPGRLSSVELTPGGAHALVDRGEADVSLRERLVAAPRRRSRCRRRRSRARRRRHRGAGRPRRWSRPSGGRRW